MSAVQHCKLYPETLLFQLFLKIGTSDIPLVELKFQQQSSHSLNATSRHAQSVEEETADPYSIEEVSL